MGNPKLFQIVNMQCDSETNRLTGEIVLPLIPPQFDGWSAAKLRALGFVIPDYVPNCAVVKWSETEWPKFEWVDLEFTIEPEVPDDS